MSERSFPLEGVIQLPKGKKKRLPSKKEKRGLSPTKVLCLVSLLTLILYLLEIILKLAGVIK